MNLGRKKSAKVNEADFEKPLFVYNYSKISSHFQEQKSNYKFAVNEYKLAKIVYQLQTFMEDFYGRSSSKPRPRTKIPASCFSDYIIGGSLHSMLQVCLEFQHENDWETFNILSCDRMQSGFELFDRLYKLLSENGFIRPHMIFLNKVPLTLMDKLQSIITSHGAICVQSAENATHLVDWDEEVDTLPEELTEEYIRTLELRSMPMDTVSGDNNVQCLALVHWYYYPDSYDEWISAADVDLSELPEALAHPTPIIPTTSKQYHVCCRFILDVSIFNEWGNEVDYEIGDGDEDNVDTVEGQWQFIGDDRGQGAGAGAGAGRSKNRNKKAVRRAKKETAVPEALSHSGKLLSEALPPSFCPDAQAQELAVLAVSSAGCQLVLQSANERKRPPIDPSDEAAAKKRQSGRPTPRTGPPEWFNPDGVSAVEIRYLPHILCPSRGQPSQAAAGYAQIRSFIIALYQQSPQHYLSATECRRKIAADVGKIISIHEFLDAFAIINYGVRIDCRPPPVSFSSRLCSQRVEEQRDWSAAQDAALRAAVTEHGADWTAVATAVRLEQRAGDAELTAADCVARFVTLPAESLLSHDADSCSVEACRWPSASRETARCVQLLGTELSGCLIRQAAATVQAQRPEDPSLQQAGAQLCLQWAASLVSGRRLTEDYVAMRLEALEEKARLLTDVDRQIEIEVNLLAADRRSVQIQKAQLAFLQHTQRPGL